MADEDQNPTSNDNRRSPSRWLYSPDPYDEKPQGETIDVTWRSQEATAEITADPGYALVRLHYGRHLELKIADDVDVERLTLELVPGSDTESTVEIRGPAPRLRCTTSASAGETAQPRLRLNVAGSIEITNGDWTFEPIAPANGPHNALSFRRGAGIALEQGSATFTSRLDGVTISGTGDVTAGDGIYRSAVDLRGDLIVGGDVVDCSIDLQGDLKTTGLVVLGQKALKCRKASDLTSLAADGEVECEFLVVTDMIRGTGTIHAARLVCGGPISAHELDVAEQLDAGGSVECELLQAGGTVALRACVNRWVSGVASGCGGR